ncbi:hypothetical protein AMAG_17241 [Allomyces macrogynus ATCC 38327]|uniref:RING-type domain-containing protein n=1 Tax=Allomyces macrogynus (strain ATCC 38327) TaxID=578462 RepID=A0A0L0TEJ6_ALLM3|nr:hypothetical protein AMAG_17241 [Allomyces macrogynus ATCC 38327]|eukprot:KNE73086.1 hypothetical protein AMAG_17241 [Allomyces macrogynus ATCC 38327]
MGGTVIRGRGWSDDEEDEDDDVDDDDVDDYGAPKGWWDRTTTASSSHQSRADDSGWFAYREPSPEDTIRIPTVEELLITEEDLERARWKLPEDEHLDAEQSIERMLGRLESHRLNSSPTTAAASRSSSAPPPSEADALTDETVVVAAGVTLAFNHIPIVTHLTVSTASHATDGPCLVLRDGAPVPSSFDDRVAYCIPGARITNVRRKFPETEDPWVAFTVNDEKFLQLVPTSDHAAAVDAIARAITAIVTADFGDRVETAAPSVEVAAPAPAVTVPARPAAGADPVAQAKPTAGTDLVALGQAMAAEIADAAAAFQSTLDEIRARYAALMTTTVAGNAVDVSPAPLPDDDVVMEEVAADCTVCYAQFVELVIDPCDHRICRKCWDRLTEPKCCPWDRAPGVTPR